MLQVDLGALRAQEGAEGDIAVCAAVLLAIDAESVELFFVDAPAQVASRLLSLGITSDIRLGHRAASALLRDHRNMGLIILGGSGIRGGGRVE